MKVRVGLTDTLPVQRILMLDLLRLGFLDGYTIYRDGQFCLWGLGPFCFLDLLVELELSPSWFPLPLNSTTLGGT